MDVGEHCSICNRIDFLPFTCSECKLFFCKDHFKSFEHKCIVIKQSSKFIKKSIIDNNKCIECGKKLYVTKCKDCNSITCMDHRFSDQHKCVKEVNNNKVSNCVKEVNNKIKKKSNCIIC